MKSVLAFIVGLVMLSSCSPRLSYTLLNKQPHAFNKEAVRVIGPEETPTDSASLIGYMKVSEGFYHSKDCMYDTVIDRMKRKTGDLGGNLIHVVKKKEGAGCSKVWADIFYDSTLRVLTLQEIQISAQSQSASNDSSSIKVNPEDTLPLQKLKRPWKLMTNFGFAYRTARTAEGLGRLSDFVDGMKQGSYYGAELTYFANELVGFGLKVQQSRFYNEMPDFIKLEDGTELWFTRTGEDFMNYYGAHVSMRLPLAVNLSFSGSLGIGLLHFQSRFQEADLFRLSEGYTLGSYQDVSLNYALAPTLDFNLHLGLPSGIVSRLTINNGFSEETLTFQEGGESLAQLIIGLGLTLRW